MIKTRGWFSLVLIGILSINGVVFAQTLELQYLLLYSSAFADSDPGQTAKLETDDPIHFRPKLPAKKTVGDVMPFYWKGEYHIFYLTKRHYFTITPPVRPLTI